MDIPAAIDRHFGAIPGFKAEVGVISGGLSVKLYGPLDLASSRALQDFLVWLIDAQYGHTSLTVDLARVNYISSTGIGALTQAFMAAERREICFRLANLQDKVRQIFVLLGLMNFFEESSLDG